MEHWNLVFFSNLKLIDKAWRKHDDSLVLADCMMKVALPLVCLRDDIMSFGGLVLEVAYLHLIL